jgi:ATP phosphoribosyltransferase regulatory subunit
MEEFLEKRPLPAHLKELFLLLPELFGGIEDLEKVEDKVKNEQSLEALARLKKLHTLLGFYGLGNYITFDLGMLSRYDYYTGIILNAYTYGTGEPVAKGGRYDSLVGQFGKDAPAIGVAIVADQLLLALERQKKVQKEEADLTVLLYTEEKSKEAISMAQKLRKSGKKVSLTGILEKEKEELVKTYQENRRIEKLIVL